MAGPNKRRRAVPQEVTEASKNLVEAMKHERPSCDGDERFTEARLAPLSAAEKRDLYLICFECPIFEACAQYAQATKPAAGFWAGKNYGTWERF